MAAKTTSKQETNKGFYHLLIMQFKQVFQFRKNKNSTMMDQNGKFFIKLSDFYR